MDSRLRLRERLARVLLGPFAEVTYSQEGEDRVLARMLGPQKDGFYVDIGAHHPIRFSNTYLLYRFGWRGVVVDPAASTIESFKAVRPRDTTVQVAVGRQRGVLTYYEFDEPAMNTLSGERAEFVTRTTGYQLLSTRTVSVERLDEILERTVPSGTSIDVLSVDAEGMDEEVLASNDWAAFTPRIIVAESLLIGSVTDLADAPVPSLLRRFGYMPVAVTGNSAVFARPEGQREGL